MTEPHWLADSDLDDEIDRFAARDREPDTTVPITVKQPPRWRRAADVVPEILSRVDEPLVPLTLGGESLVQVRAGGIVTLVGGAGSGKTSLLAALLTEHARERGPALCISRELPRDEFVARLIGMQTDAAWLDVLTGKVPEHEMRRVIPDRLVIADRADASLEVLADLLAYVRHEHPDAPMMVGLDYLQIIESAQREKRMQVDDVMTRLDATTRGNRAVAIALSQSSRPGARALRNGEATGADTADLGAESSAIERWASVTLAIGAPGGEREDGTKVVGIAIGKARMTGGDREQPATYNGRSGRWRLDGEARPAAEVRAERQAAKADQAANTTDHAIADIIATSDKPVTRAELSGRGMGHGAVTASVARLLEAGRIVEVRRKAPRGRYWSLWTRERADAAGIEVVS